MIEGESTCWFVLGILKGVNATGIVLVFFFFVKVSSIVIMNDDDSDDSDDHDEKHSDADCGGGCAHDHVLPVNRKKHKRQAP